MTSGSDVLNPEQAKARFSTLVHAEAWTYREFDDPAGGIWRPEFFAGALVRYRLYTEPKAVKPTM